MISYKRLLLIFVVVLFACSLFIPTGEAWRDGNQINAPSGTITIVTHYKSDVSNQSPIPGSQTATFTKQFFTDDNCSTGGGAVTTVTGVNSSPGHSFTLNSGSVLITPAQTSDQNGGFAFSWIPASGNFSNFTNQGNGICVKSTVTDTFRAIYNVGIVMLNNTCTTPKTDFNLSETVCAKVYGDPKSYCSTNVIAFNVIFVDPNNAGRFTSPDLTLDQQTTTFTLPSTNTEGTAKDNRGLWFARVVPKCTSSQGSQGFFVHNPFAPAADMDITKTSSSSDVRNGGSMQYEIRVFNFDGPDPAANASWTDTLPAGTTFLSLTRISGPGFNCTTPAVGATGTITCNALAPLPRVLGGSDPDAAVFRLVIKNNNASGTINNTANATTSTTDLNSTNDSATASVAIGNVCSFTNGCVPDMNVTANTTCPDGKPGRIVTFVDPATAGSCTIAAFPASGSCFSAGTTLVTYQSLSSTASCSFLITVASPTASESEVAGAIVDNIGQPVEGVTVNMDGAQRRKTITDANGRYRFENVETNGFYNVTPSRANFTFSPSMRSFSQIGQSTEAVFTATPISDNINVIDTADYFVRQHYLDFLGREPDEAGFNFWSDQIISCGADDDCAERRTINVSAAYFLSIEFMHTGGFVDGLYRASYGRRPLYAEFMPDARTVAQNVIVGTTGWSETLANNQQAFLNAWVERPAFHAAYDGLSNGHYVDALIAHTGASFSAAERDALVNSLNNQSSSRAEVLRAISENNGFVSAKRNEMFVMMEYFGYLRRDPDEAGFNFWLNKLNQHNGNFEQAEMVKSFLVSGEYRARFAR